MAYLQHQRSCTVDVRRRCADVQSDDNSLARLWRCEALRYAGDVLCVLIVQLWASLQWHWCELVSAAGELP